jgi:hypothetical protein
MALCHEVLLVDWWWRGDGVLSRDCMPGALGVHVYRCSRKQKEDGGCLVKLKFLCVVHVLLLLWVGC